MTKVLVKFDPNHFKFQFLQNNSDSNVRPFPYQYHQLQKIIKIEFGLAQ